MSSSNKITTRNPGIDLVRGVSIILVVIHHTALRIPLAKTGLAAILPRRLLTGLSWDGYEAVFVFFVVSGFLITQNALTRWGALARLDPRAFYARRAARIVPCLLALLAALSLLHLLRAPNYVIAAPQSLPAALLAALTLRLNWYEGQTGWLPGGWDILWSLSIEEVFYLAFPLICLTLGRSRTLLTILLAALALSLPAALTALAGAPEIWREKAYLPGMAALAMGACAALATAQLPTPSRRAAAATGWLGTILIAALFWREDLADQLLGHATMLALTLSVALLMLAFYWGWGRRGAARGTAWLRSCGRLSYEIYLTHMFVVFTLVGLFHRSGSNLSLGWLWFPPILALSWALGSLLSRPADRWLRSKRFFFEKKNQKTFAT